MDENEGTIRYVEFVDGHSEDDVSKGEAAEKIEDAMEKNEYVAIEKKDGTTKTSVDIKNEAKKESNGDKKKEKEITKAKVKEELKGAKTVKQVKHVSGG